jgi:hypothetical protein
MRPALWAFGLRAGGVHQRLRISACPRPAPPSATIAHLHHQHAVRQQQRLRHVVRDEDRGQPNPVVQRADRVLVSQVTGSAPNASSEQQQLGAGCERVTDALALAAQARRASLSAISRGGRRDRAARPPSPRCVPRSSK